MSSFFFNARISSVSSLDTGSIEKFGINAICLISCILCGCVRGIYTFTECTNAKSDIPTKAHSFVICLIDISVSIISDGMYKSVLVSFFLTAITTDETASTPTNIIPKYLVISFKSVPTENLYPE